MLDLDSPRWTELSHAYGLATDVPELLKQLESVAQGRYIPPLAEHNFQIEPWFSLWSSLCHQGDVYTASYAAVPHVVRIAAQAQQGHWEYFAIVTNIEICRAVSGPDIPEDLASAYVSALHQVHDLAYDLRALEWDELLSRSIAAALVVCKGQTRLGNAIRESSPEEITRFFQMIGLEAEDAEEGA